MTHSKASSSNPWVLFAALILGVLLGAIAHPYHETPFIQTLNGTLLYSIGQVFLRLIFMVVVPLIFSALVLGTLELARGTGVGRIALKTLFFTLVASAASVFVGVTLVQVFKPGAGFPIDAATVAERASDINSIQGNAAKAKGAIQGLLDLIPKNPLDAAVNALNGEMIALMVFALIFGIAFASVIRERDSSKPTILEQLLEDLLATSMKVVGVAMRLAPLAVFSMIFQNVSKLGLGMLWNLGAYAGLVILGLLIQQFVVYGFLLKTFTTRSPLAFFYACREAYLYAFSTASSNATLPTALATAEGRLGLPPRIARFVLTVGASANQNGTALFEGITVLFLAQVYGVQLDLMQQCQVVAMSILAGIGTAGVPGGSLPLIAILLQNLGIPAEGLGLILGVDRFLDMARTTLNVSGDLVIAALVAHGAESELPHIEPALQ